MKPTLRKSMAFLLAAVMLFGASPIIGIDFSLRASAADESDLTFELINGGTEYEIVACKDTVSGELTIPATYNGKPVTSIGDHAFVWIVSITSVAIPGSVKTIGESAFDNCQNLQEANIAEGVEKIGLYAFYKTNLSEITIPSSVTKIDDEAFSNCQNLTTIDVDEANTKYSSEDGVLFNKTKTKLLQYPAGKSDVTYTISDGVVMVGVAAFEYSLIENLFIPASVKSFDSYAIDDCVSLKSITVDDDNAVFFSQDGVLFSKDKTVLYKYPNANVRTSYTVPASVIEIAANAFMNARSLEEVNLQDGLKTIGRYAFDGCFRLFDVSIPHSVEFIGHDVFYYTEFYLEDTFWDDGLLCLDGWLLGVKDDVTQIDIPMDIYGVAENASRWCNEVESVAIPESVEIICDRAFTLASNLAEITVDPDNPNYCVENNVLFNKDKTELIIRAPKTAPTAYIVPDGVVKIADEAFCSSENLADITIPESVNSIGTGAFDGTAFRGNDSNWTDGVLYLDNCLLAAKSAIEDIVILPDTRMIANDAFFYCYKLTEVQIPESVEYIGGWAFEQCINLTSITILNSDTLIGEMAFYGVADDFVIKSYSGSTAETYANENDIAFEAISHAVTGVALDITSKALIVGATQQLTATVAPANATNKAVTWSSSDTSIATVSATGLVTAKAAGTATITVTTADGNRTATCLLTVRENRVAKVEIQTMPNIHSYTYKKDSFNKAGLTIKVTYESGKVGFVTDTEKIDVNGFDNSKRGEQKLTVEYEGIQAEEKITVTVKYVWWQWIIRILLFGWIWY